ncbi:siphovirus Gp157 family protein [uncultured Dubosiella sp.]|uniref:siphovirus Gp157 family protein n=1 Tax=uncultured Dubosiella sp. TaxID=1937011 RepID=UPI00272F85D0|nr:siphovirus Gp157 family protein [uncultured Dubosiella sp.]
MKLLEINKAILEVLEKGFTTNEETGEVFEAEDLEQLEMAFEDKVDGIAYYIKNYETSVKAIKEEIKLLNERAKRYENRAKWLRKYLLAAMNARELDKVETIKNTIFTRKSYFVNIVDQDALPKKYFIKKIDYSPDKKMIKETLDAGKRVKGAEIQARVNLQLK